MYIFIDYLYGCVVTYLQHYNCKLSPDHEYGQDWVLKVGVIQPALVFKYNAVNIHIVQ